MFDYIIADDQVKVFIRQLTMRFKIGSPDDIWQLVNCLGSCFMIRFYPPIFTGNTKVISEMTISTADFQNPGIVFREPGNHIRPLSAINLFHISFVDVIYHLILGIDQR